MKTFLKAITFISISVASASMMTAEADVVRLSDLDLSKITCFEDGGKCSVGKNVSTTGHSLSIAGVSYDNGIGVHAPSKTIVQLNGATSFQGLIGVDDEADDKPDHGIIDYTVSLYKDKKAEVRYSGTASRMEAARNIDVTDLAGYDYLEINITNGAQAWADHTDVVNASFTYNGEAPATVTEDEMYPDPNKPAIVQLPAEGPDGEEIIPLSSLDLSLCTNGWGAIKVDKSIDGNVLTVKGQKYASGVGMHASGKVVVKLNGAVTAFHAILGIDDEVGSKARGGRCNYSVVLRKQNAEELVVSAGELIQSEGAIAVIDITENLSDYKYLILEFDEGDGNENDHVDIVNAYFEYVEQNSTRPEMVNENVLAAGINCATTVFSQPGVRFMHKIRSSNPDIKITVNNLPAGLTFNEKRSLVEGIIDEEGEYSYTAVATSGEETIEAPVKLTVSSELQQPLPHMGWLSWNVVQGEISEEVVKQATDNMIASGLRDAGYDHVLMDDLWHGTRASGTNKPRPNTTRFPNGLKPVSDYVHDHGMKFGLYTDAAGSTCAGAFGSFGYETIDAKQYAEWEIDYVKCDYCHAPGDVASAKERYTTMGKALNKTGRNIVFHICEWGVRNPWEWGAEALGSSWRVTYDVRDGWNCRQGGIGMVQSVEQMKDLWIYNGVNRWNDADMLCVGINGTGKSSSDLVIGTPGMTKTEYRSQFAMWCMWSSPLSLSFDIRKPISDEDLAIMTNPEMIALDQDCMGQAAEYLGKDLNECYLFAKDLENGDVAVAVINMSDKDHTYTIDFSKIPALDPTVTYTVRDVQNLDDCPDATGRIADVSVATHETRVFRLHDPQSEVEVSEITVSPAEFSGKVGETQQLKATVAPANATDRNVTWSTSNELVATVSKVGLVTIVGEGNAIVTATSSNGLTATCAVTGTADAGIDDSISEVIASDSQVEIFTVLGQHVYSGRYVDARLPQGIYVVRCGSLVGKVRI